MNPDLQTAGKATQFAAGDRRKRGGDTAWSIRNQMRYIAAQKVDITKDGALEELFGTTPTIAQRAAFNALRQAVQTTDDVKPIEFADDRIDGKLPQTNINAQINEIMKMTDEELRSFHNSITAGLPGASSDGHRSGAGDEAPRHASETTAGTSSTGAEPSV